MENNGRSSLLEAQENANLARPSYRDLWPYPWVYPPPGFQRFHVRGSIESPVAAATFTTVCEYQCPPGFVGVLVKIMNVFTGVNFIEGSGDALWRIDINRPSNATLATGYDLQDYSSIVTTLGSFAQMLEIVPSIFEDGQTIRYKFRNVQNIGVGTPNFVHCALMGYIYPMRRG